MRLSIATFAAMLQVNTGNFGIYEVTYNSPLDMSTMRSWTDLESEPDCQNVVTRLSGEWRRKSYNICRGRRIEDG